jgi:hypothetical protein
MSTSAGAKRPHPDSHDLSDDEDADLAVVSSSGHKAMGFGNIRRMGVHNVFTRGQIIPYILRWQLRVVLDFTQSLNPHIIPYQNLAFWTGTWIKNPTQNYATPSSHTSPTSEATGVSPSPEQHESVLPFSSSTTETTSTSSTVPSAEVATRFAPVIELPASCLSATQEIQKWLLHQPVLGTSDGSTTICLRKGVQNAYCVGNTTRAELRPIYNLFRQLQATQDPNRIITDSRCVTYFEQKKHQRRARIGTAKLKHLADILMQQINEYGILSAQQWENKISPDVKLQLIREYGLSVDGYIQRLILITKTKRVLDIKTKTLTQLLIDDILIVFPDIDQSFLQNVQWLRNLFQANDIDIIEFLAWNEIIKTKRYTKINGLCLQGRTNAGKSLIIDTLIRVCIPEEIPRERDNSGFHLDQLPSAATALFEEPLITPITVGTWKLLLEGKVIKTDIKHKDKEGIPRIPIWITTAIPIDTHVDNNESIQLKQRVKTFFFKYGIEHRTENMNVAITED